MPTRPTIEVEGQADISKIDHNLIRYLFRDCRQVHLRVLDGGFSGNLVLGSNSVDLHGHRQAPHVIKIGPQGPIGQERTAFERIEGVLGNNAPRITQFADLEERGALKYRYAAMGGGFSDTFQKLYSNGLSREKTEQYLTTVFAEQLGRFYDAAALERCNLLEYYMFSPQWAASVRDRVVEITGAPAHERTVCLPGGREMPNIYWFYKETLAEILPLAAGSAYFSYLHGDLNGANIIVDAQDNVWLIDFFHTHRGHVLKDLIKLENDLLYIFTPVHNEYDLKEALRLTDILLQVEDLGRPLPYGETTGLNHPEMRRAYETIRFMRSFYPRLVHEDRNALQLLIGQMRYAVHTLSFDESNDWQKQWALYTAAKCSVEIARRLKQSGPLRVDWLDEQYTGSGRIGLTLLPGRRDYGRVLGEDLDSLKKQGVSDIVCLITEDEFGVYGVDGLLDAYQAADFKTRHLPILDQSVCTPAEMSELVQWLTQETDNEANVLIHCVGGLGRSGLVAACYLMSKGFSADDAIVEVRRARSPRAIESAAQEAFIQSYQ